MSSGWVRRRHGRCGATCSCGCRSRRPSGWPTRRSPIRPNRWPSESEAADQLRRGAAAGLPRTREAAHDQVGGGGGSHEHPPTACCPLVPTPERQSEGPLLRLGHPPTSARLSLVQLETGLENHSILAAAVSHIGLRAGKNNQLDVGHRIRLRDYSFARSHYYTLVLKAAMSNRRHVGTTKVPMPADISLYAEGAPVHFGHLRSWGGSLSARAIAG